MAGWDHRRDGHEFEQAPGVGKGQGSLAAAVHGLRSNNREGTQPRPSTENWIKERLRKFDAFELWCWRILLESKEIQPVHPKRNQS